MPKSYRTVLEKFVTRDHVSVVFLLFFFPQVLISSDSLFVAVSPANGNHFCNPRGFPLRWQATYDRFSLLFGTDSTSLNLVATDLPHQSCEIGPLGSGRTYYWRVIGENGSGMRDTSALWSFGTQAPTLVRNRFLPSEDSSNYDTELDSKVISFGKEIDLGNTGLLVMDFWNNTVAQYPAASANIMSLIQFARKNGIPVVHLLHEGWQNPAVQADSGEHVVDIKNYNNHIESYLDQNNITTVLVAGYGTGECVTISRVNSIHRISQRSPGKYEFILLKDCTEGDNQYAWGMNGVETRFQSSSLSDLFQSVGVEDTVYQTSGQVDGEFFTRIKPDFGTNPILFDTCALVLVNAWETHPNDGFAQRIKENLTDNILPMLHFARAKGMKIVHVTNGRP